MSFIPLSVDLVGYDPPPMFPNTRWADFDPVLHFLVVSVQPLPDREYTLRIYLGRYSWAFVNGQRPGE